MSLKTRIIPVLYTNSFTDAIQTIGYSLRRNVGTLMQHVINMNERSVDELMIIDISKDRYDREPHFDKLKEVASEVFSPLTYGGGIRTIEHIEKALESGADKVLIGKGNYNYKLINDAAKKFGSQCIVISIDENNETSKIHAKNLIYQGAGEILLNYKSRNGMKEGYSIRQITYFNDLHVPVIANCGCGNPLHMVEAITAGANAVAASTMFLFTEWTPKSCAKYLRQSGIPTRI